METSVELEDDWEPQPVEDYCTRCDESFTDFWCEDCGYHGHDCSELIGEDEDDE
jgi:hypothetical protein